MAVETLSCVPCVIEAGTTVRFLVSNGDFSAANWTLAFVINNGLVAPLSVAGTTHTDGVSFAVALSAAQTAALPQGPAQWGEMFTAIVGGDKDLGRTGTLNVLPGIVATGTPSPAQANVTALEAAILNANGKQFISVSFNGQSHTRFPLGDAQKQLVFWKSRVIAEQTNLRRLRGERVGGEIGVEFAPASPVRSCW